MNDKTDACMRMVKAALQLGHENAKSLSEIVAETGIDERSVKACIQLIRAQHHIPVVSSASGGYFIPKENDEEDIRLAMRFVDMQGTQAKSRFYTARSVKRWLNERGQLPIGGCVK